MMRVHKTGAAVTLIFHGVLLTLLIFFGLSFPLPLPPEEGILVNFGVDETGFGAEELMQAEIARSASVPVPQQTGQTQTENLTQDFEDAPVIEEKKRVVKKPQETVKPVETKKTPTQQVTEQPVQEVKREVNKRALYTGAKSGGATGSEGVAGGTGNQGSPFGSVDSDNHGKGNSRGNGGVSYSLDGRNPLYLSTPPKKFKSEGKVVVEVLVDKDGNVTQARPGVRGSTTLDEELLELAKSAALKSKFDLKSDAPAFQKGTITYHFQFTN